MIHGKYLNKSGIFFLLLTFLIFFSCKTGSEKAVGQITEKLSFGVSELVQQELSDEDFLDTGDYSLYISISEKGPIIPGLFQGTVPQGMAFYSEEDLMLISNYMFDGRPSCITSVKMSTGLLEKIFWLLNPDGSPHFGHVGGLSVSRKYLWIASGKGVYYILLEKLLNQNDNSKLEMTSFVPTAAKGSFSTFSDGILWVGEFTSKDRSYTVPKTHSFKTLEGNINHAWMAGFILDKVSDMINIDSKIGDVNYPDYILSIPDEVQGAAFINNQIILSQSYGRNNNSRISVYSNPLGEPAHSDYNTEKEKSIPVWILDDRNLEVEIIAPPMTEGIADYKGAIAVLYESGSDKYRSTAKNPQDRVHILNLK